MSIGTSSIKISLQRNKEPLNQIYRRKKTFVDYPEIEALFTDITNYCLSNSFVKVLENSDVEVRGRRYDQALILYVLKHAKEISSKVCWDFNTLGKLKVCEIGPRDGILGPYLTNKVGEVHLIDNFEGWGKGTEDDLGQIETWSKIWNEAALNKDNLIIQTMDAKHTTYEDCYFDFIYATSVIDHVYSQSTDEISGETNGHFLMIEELRRILKVGGCLALSLTAGMETNFISGTHVFTEEDVKKMFLENGNFEMLGSSDFNFKSKYNDSIYQLGNQYPISIFIMFLIKVK
jgi:hypothetical protein